jgi:hypothetical protein
MWKIANEVISNKPLSFNRKIVLSSVDGKLIDPGGVADAFNGYFADVGRLFLPDFKPTNIENWSRMVLCCANSKKLH